jgi:hypothetical protein
MAMLTFRGSDGMMVATYLHRLDAALSSPSLKEAGRLWPVNLQEIHLHDFMEQNGCLRITINYAFAADRKRLVHDGRQFLLMTYLTEQFAVPREQWDHFSVQFSDRMVLHMDRVGWAVTATVALSREHPSGPGVIIVHHIDLARRDPVRRWTSA